METRGTFHPSPQSQTSMNDLSKTFLKLKSWKQLTRNYRKQKQKTYFWKLCFLEEFSSLRPHFWMVKHSPVLLQAFICALYSHRKDQCSSHGKFLTFILSQRGTNSHKRHFLWPRQLWKLWRWNTSFGLLKCGFPLVLRRAHRLRARLWVVCPLHLCPAACSPGHSLAGICRITANYEHSELAHDGAWHRYAHCSLKRGVAVLFVGPRLPLPSNLQHISLCPSRKHWAFPVSLASWALLQPVLGTEAGVAHFEGQSWPLSGSKGCFFWPFRRLTWGFPAAWKYCSWCPIQWGKAPWKAVCVQDIVQGETASSEQVNGEHRLLQQCTIARTFHVLEYLSRVTKAVKKL